MLYQALLVELECNRGLIADFRNKPLFVLFDAKGPGDLTCSFIRAAKGHGEDQIRLIADPERFKRCVFVNVAGIAHPVLEIMASRRVTKRLQIVLCGIIRRNNALPMISYMRGLSHRKRRVKSDHERIGMHAAKVTRVDHPRLRQP